MRKQTKLVAVLSAAALLAIGASMTSFAATGWAEEDGTWVYYDKDGNRATDKWEKSGNNWFYLDGNGEMSTDTVIDDGTNVYYVNSDGAMAANQWIAIANESAGDTDEPDSYWYYFQANGKAYKAPTSGNTTFKTINGKKYAFDSDGKMLYGWVNSSSERVTGDDAWMGDSIYFCGDENDGAQATAWAKISVIDTNNQDGDDQDYWFYFNPSNGKKTTDATAKTINGKKYAFDTNGVMQNEWYTTATASNEVSSVSNYKYFNSPDEGWRLQKGWVKVVPSENVNSTAYNDDSAKWFYADGSGNIYTAALKTINNKKYAFNEKGEMLSGLWAIKFTNPVAKTTISLKKNDDNTKNVIDAVNIDKAENQDLIKDAKYDGYTIMYFGGGDDGSAKTGTQSVDVDGEVFTYTFGTTGGTKYVGSDVTFDSNGKGVIQKSDKAIYIRGQKIKADSDMRYQAVILDRKSSNGKVGDKVNYEKALGGYLVNTSGSIMQNRASGVKDADGYTYVTGTTGIVTKVLDSEGKIVAGK